MVALALRNADPEPVAAILSREDVLARYRHLRTISMRHHSVLVRNYLSHDAVLQNARRIGLAVTSTLVLDDVEELAFVFDLAIHTRLLGRSRAIDRYARLAGFATDSDEALMLESMRQSHFSFFRVARRHETAGVILEDLIHEFEVWLMDEGIESSVPDSALLAARLYEADRFFMTAGVVVPLDRYMKDDLLAEMKRLPRSLRSDDRRFAEAIYRVALKHRLSEQIASLDLELEAG
jgi:hypothetical protein